MQSLQSQLADAEKQLSSKTADLKSCMAFIHRFKEVTEEEAEDLLARFRAGQNVEEPSVRFAVQPERDSLGGSSPGIRHPLKRQISFTSALRLAPEPSIAQVRPFASHLSIMQWGSNLTAQFDACLQAGISALGPAYRARNNGLLSTPAVDITADGLLYQVSGLLAITSSDCRNRHFQTWPILNLVRYNVLGPLRTALSEPNTSSDILVSLVAILTGWEQVSQSRARNYAFSNDSSMSLKLLPDAW